MNQVISAGREAVMSGHQRQLFVGIDLGTSGVRALAVTESGARVGSVERPLSAGCRQEGLHEQDPAEWWAALCESTQSLAQTVNSAGDHCEIRGICITSTSGTLVLADQEGRPVRPALLYDDRRGSELAQTLNSRLAGANLNSSFSLIKAAWVMQSEPRVWERARHILHPADWLAGRLRNTFGVSDYSNALKLGYDPALKCWGQATRVARLPAGYLPQVVSPGELIGGISVCAARATGLPAGTPVFAGATDGIASLIGSGASRIGDSNTTLGTTLVWKTLTNERVPHRNGVYSHLHPSGLWAPGAASNTGCGCLETPSSTLEPCELDQRALAYIPNSSICYLLSSAGERFPFFDPEAVGFVERRPTNPDEWRAAQLQSLAFVERWGYEVLESTGARVGECVFSTGAAARSDALSQIRADVLARSVVRVRCAGSALGAAILAAAGGFYGGGALAAITAMARVAARHDPSIEGRRCLDEYYGRFREECRRRGYS